MTSLFFSRGSIAARTFTLPRPSSYSDTSIVPPSWKSGYSTTGFLRIRSISACRSSGKLCGRMAVESPTAMPSAPNMSSSGILAGSSTGSLLRPSYDGTYSVVFGLNTSLRARSESWHSMYRGAAAGIPV